MNFLTEESDCESSFVKLHLHDEMSASAVKAKLELLHRQLTDLFANQLNRNLEDLSEENIDPASNPVFWISKWIDYSDKYGFGYQLCDEGIGVMFNDGTKLIQLSNGV